MSSTALVPRYGLLDAMGEFTQLEILALVSTCSHAAKARVDPLLKVKMSDKGEAYGLVTRLFPNIKNLVHHSQQVDASLYICLLNSYFAPRKGLQLPEFCEVSQKIGEIRHKFNYKFEGLLQDIVPEMQTVHGREMLVKAVDAWIVATNKNRTRCACKSLNDKQLKWLERVKDTVLNDFAVVYHRISTVHQESDIYPW